MNLDKLNQDLIHMTPLERVKWAMEIATRPVITTNFRPYEGALLHLTTSIRKDLPVIWCDTGYNTPQTYRHAEELIQSLGLNIDLFVPNQSKAHRDVVLGIPAVDHEDHILFTEQVKLEPFKRALNKHKPDVWFTNLRKGQTSNRDGLGIVSQSKSGILKVSPFYEFNDQDLDTYLEKFKLPNEFIYFDPTKVEANRECGLHTTL